MKNFANRKHVGRRNKNDSLIYKKANSQQLKTQNVISRSK